MWWKRVLASLFGTEPAPLLTEAATTPEKQPSDRPTPSMRRSNEDDFRRALAFVLAHEGGFVNDPADPGGATNLGITLRTLRQFLPGASVETLRRLQPDDEIVVRIYRTFWSEDLDPVIRFYLFDTAVNLGRARAERLHEQAKAEAGGDPIRELLRLHHLRMEHYRGLEKLWPRFGRGWSRRAEKALLGAIE